MTRWKVCNKKIVAFKLECLQFCQVISTPLRIRAEFRDGEMRNNANTNNLILIFTVILIDIVIVIVIANVIDVLAVEIRLLETCHHMDALPLLIPSLGW